GDDREGVGQGLGPGADVELAGGTGQRCLAGAGERNPALVGGRVEMALEPGPAASAAGEAEHGHRLVVHAEVALERGAGGVGAEMVEPAGDALLVGRKTSGRHAQAPQGQLRKTTAHLSVSLRYLPRVFSAPSSSARTPATSAPVGARDADTRSRMATASVSCLR